MSHEHQIFRQIERGLLRDQHRLRRQWRQLQRTSRESPAGELLARFHEQLRASLATVEKRRADRPDVQFSQDLPIQAHRGEIAAAIRDRQVVVISGETGSGKSTQLPKICLAAGFGIRGAIGHTQPRRIAARTLAARISEELQRPLGQSVGFKIRFTDRTDERTYIKLMTDGILLAETQGDRFLNQYEVLIIDEAHERSLNIDFLLGYLYQLLPKRPELRVIITSATIDAQRFSRHFTCEQGPAPIIEVSGRGYPVEVRYRPPGPQPDDSAVEQTETAAMVAAVHELAALDRGHILIFLPTERDIRDAAKRLRQELGPGDGPHRTEILPLYARLSAAEQNRVFHPFVGRRIILATNVAESSLTVPKVRYVIDSGTARISRYAPRSKVQRLPIEAVSRASADQRMGRCGRVAPGVCIRLYHEEDYLRRPAFTTPEIQRTNLAAVILRAKALKLGQVEDFPFLDPPRPEAIRDGYSTLFELGAVDEERELTDLGRRLSRFPVDPRLARVLLAADEQGCLAEILIIAAALEIQDPRDRPYDKGQQADERHGRFVDEQSDFLSYLKLWDFFHDLKGRLSRSRLRRACVENFLSFNRLREWTEVHRQLMKLASGCGLQWHARHDDYQKTHRALLAGFLSGVAYRSAEHEYTGAGGVKFQLWPGSGLFQSKPKWCLVAELVETRRRYGRTVAKIQPQWIEPLAEHVLKRRYDEPHWHRPSGRVMAWESVTLFGLPIVARRRVPFGPVDPQLASEIFVRDGLAQRNLECRDKFYRCNEQVIERCAQLAAKTRRADWIVDEFSLYRFYNSRLPSDIYDLVTLRKWLKKNPKNRESLRMHVTDLLAQSAPEETPEAFPDQLPLGTVTLPVQYKFAPGAEDDGLTVTVPEDGLGQLDGARTEWLVPGLLEEKILALIRSLPKPIRRGLIPAPETARRVAHLLRNGQGDFLEAVVAKLSEIAEEPISPNVIHWEKLPPHLRLNVRVVDAKGTVVGESRDLTALRRQLVDSTPVTVSSDDHERWNRDGITRWDFGRLPEQIPVDRHGIEIAAYPTLQDQDDHVQLRLVASAELALRQSRDGVRRLYVIGHRRALRSQVNWLPRWDEIGVWSAPIVGRQSLTRQVTDLIADRAFFQGREQIPRDAEEYSARLENAAERIGTATQEVARLLPKLFEATHQARLAMERYRAEKWKSALTDVEGQWSALLAENFLVDTPWTWLAEYPRYFKAIGYRLERLGSGSLERDQASTREIAVYWQRYVERSAELLSRGEWNGELEHLRWMLEEYRVSCFAQPLGTSISVSAQRLDKQWIKATKGASVG